MYRYGLGPTPGHADEQIQVAKRGAIERRTALRLLGGLQGHAASGFQRRRGVESDPRRICEQNTDLRMYMKVATALAYVR
jgi:hypothetical protein